MSVFALFRGASLLKQVITLGAMFLAVAGSYYAWKKHVFNTGWRDAIAAVARGDDKAIKNAQEGRVTYNACRDSGGVWNPTASSGQCKRR